MSSSAKARREDKNKNVAQQLQEFANDSITFFNKCAKPDRNGMLIKIKTFSLNRVHENITGMRNGILRYWIHWLYN